MRKIRDYSLYLVISEEYAYGKSALEIAEAAITGGVDIIQMREKNKPRQKLVELGAGLSRLCKDKGVIFIVNDDPIIAKEAGADGVHLGQGDRERYPIDKVRKMLGKDRIIGLSTHSIGQFERANIEDVDYIAFGPIFPTKTKDYCIGLDGVKKVLEISTKPIFFIGGIDLSNIDGLLEEGARNIALIRGITEAADITSAAREFEGLINGRHIRDRR